MKPLGGLVFLVLLNTCWADNATVDYLAENLAIQYDVITNFLDNPADRTMVEVRITNTGDELAGEGASWEIFFCSVRMWFPGWLRDDPDIGVIIGNSGILVYHINGCLHKLAPANSFPGFFPGQTVELLPVLTSDWTVSRTDISPNWYAYYENDDGWYSNTIASTSDESLDFVGDFNTSEQWKRRDFDEYNPYTAEDRYATFENTPDLGEATIPIIPTPQQYVTESDELVNIEGWVVYSSSEETTIASQFLAEKLGLEVTGDDPGSEVIKLEIGDIVDIDSEDVNDDEAYRIDIDGANGVIEISGNDLNGLIYGAQSLISLSIGNEGTIPDVTVVDWPRFPYRGFMPDVSRNFLPKSDVLKTLEVMAMYKLNKFHFHLSDDEGWRLEIPGLEELTTVGGSRCADLTETSCIISQLGSGHDSSSGGSGFYTVDDYREILQFADDMGIEVIPEFDSPGHGHAPIKAMEARFTLTGDSEYLLHDPNDESAYVSIQYFRDNAINPCLDSTYNFFRKVMQEVKTMHEDIQPLKTFNFGGDEVPHGAWAESPACADLDMTPEELKKYFVTNIAVLAEEEGLDLAGWEDGLMSEADNVPYERELFPNANVYGYAWNNIWEWGGGSRAYILANSDYQVILSHATDLYFDMPYEPDPEERGFYWATRFTETRNTFNYMPDRVYDNMEVDLFGRPLNQEDVCDSVGCVPLEEGKEENILGIAGQLWSETVRTPEQFYYMVFPRLIALAERAWHKAEWEIMQDEQERKAERDNNWADFANTLGYKELQRIDDIAVAYRVPPPGAMIEDGEMTVASCVPGLQIEYCIDECSSWQLYEGPVEIAPEETAFLRTQSTDGLRYSRTISISRED